MITFLFLTVISCVFHVWADLFMCPAGTWVTQITGRAGSALDSIQLHCSNDTSLSPYGGNGGNPFTLPYVETGIYFIQKNTIDSFDTIIMYDNAQNPTFSSYGQYITYSGCLMVGANMSIEIFPINVTVVGTFVPVLECLELSFSCPVGTFVNQISSFVGDIVFSIQVGCSDGSFSEWYGDNSTGTNISNEYPIGAFDMQTLTDPTDQILSSFEVDGIVYGINSNQTINTDTPYSQCPINGIFYVLEYFDDVSSGLSVIGVKSLRPTFGCLEQIFVCPNSGFVYEYSVFEKNSRVISLIISCSNSSLAVILLPFSTAANTEVKVFDGSVSIEITNTIDGDQNISYTSVPDNCQIYGFNYNITYTLTAGDSERYEILGLAPQLACDSLDDFTSLETTTASSAWSPDVTFSISVSSYSSALNTKDTSNLYVSTSASSLTAGYIVFSIQLSVLLLCSIAILIMWKNWFKGKAQTPIGTNPKYSLENINNNNSQ